MTKLIILSASVGAGHTRAAEALAKAAKGIEVIHLDVLDFVPAWFSMLYRGCFFLIVRQMPFLWGYFYAKREKTWFLPLSRKISRLLSKPLRARIAKEMPTHIICTHFMPIDMLDDPLWVVITDYDAHPFWLDPKVTGYCIASDEMVVKGIDPAKVHVTGIPIIDVKTEKGSEKAVLVLSGGFGVGDIEGIVKALLTIPCHIIAIAGHNRALQEKLSAVEVYGYVSNMEEFLSRATLVVTKAGGLTVSECLASGTPMVIYNAILGQERCNSDFVVGHGAALKADNLKELTAKVTLLLQDEQLLAQLRRNAFRLAKPHAAQAILELVLA